MKKNKTSSHWISLSDMMTGLMLVFLLISISVISELDKKKKELEEKDKEKNRILIEYNNSKGELFKELKKAFEEKESTWQMQIEDDLTIKFENPDVLFSPNSPNLQDNFKEILNEFIPEYLSIINEDKYSSKIKEIKIEGHAGKCEAYQYNICLELSQDRSNNVLYYIFNSEYYNNLITSDKNKIKFWITSNGMSDGKNLDSNAEYTYISGLEVDPKISRRVEFRIVTNSEELVQKITQSGNLNINNN